MVDLARLFLSVWPTRVQRPISALSCDPSVIWSMVGMFLGRGRSPLAVGREYHSPWCWPQTHINGMLKQPLLLWKEISMWGPPGTLNKYVYFKVSRLFWYLGLNCLFEPVTILAALSRFSRSAVAGGHKGTSDQKGDGISFLQFWASCLLWTCCQKFIQSYLNTDLHLINWSDN